MQLLRVFQWKGEIRFGEQCAKDQAAGASKLYCLGCLFLPYYAD